MIHYNERFRDIRFDYQIKQIEVAKILGLSQSTYNSYELENNPIPLKYLIKFCDHFDVAIDYIFGFYRDNPFHEFKKEYELKQIGKRIWKIRIENNLSQLQLSDNLNINSSTLCKIEKGKLLVSTEALYTLCKDFNISADYILGRREEKYLNIKEGLHA